MYLVERMKYYYQIISQLTIRMRENFTLHVILVRMECIVSQVFERLKAVLPKFRHKVVGVPADCAAPGLGLTLADRQLLTDKVPHMCWTCRHTEFLLIIY